MKRLTFLAAVLLLASCKQRYPQKDIDDLIMGCSNGGVNKERIDYCTCAANLLQEELSYQEFLNQVAHNGSIPEGLLTRVRLRCTK